VAAKIIHQDELGACVGVKYLLSKRPADKAASAGYYRPAICFEPPVSLSAVYSSSFFIK
jgi:hypothetical protein